MRILILGGTRFIGPAAVERLVELGHEVTVFHRGQSRAPVPPSVHHMLGNRRSLNDFIEQFQKLAPEVVLDMLPVTERDAQSVMKVFKGITRRIVAISSADVYRAYGRLIGTEPGPTEPVPIHEDSPLREKLYPYRGQGGMMDDYDKILVERTVLGTPELPGTILRLPMVHGPRDTQHRLFPFLKRMMDRRPAILLDEGVAAWRCARSYVEDVGEAIALAVTDERAAGRVFNVAEPETETTRAWVERLARLVGWRGEVIVLPKEETPSHLSWGIDATQDLMLDSTRIREEIGFREPTDPTVALERTIEWERAHPPEKIDPAQYDYVKESAAIYKARRGA